MGPLRSLPLRSGGGSPVFCDDRMATISQLRAYLAMDPANARLACELVDALFAEGEYAAANEEIDALPAAVRSDLGMRFRQARCALVLGDYSAAAVQFERMMAEGYETPVVAHDLGFCRLCFRDLEGARQAVDSAIQQFGDDASLALLRARIAMMARDYEGVEQALDAALAHSPQHPTALGLRALSRLDAGDAVGAADSAAAALATHPDQHEALLVAGTTALWDRDEANAETCFQRALSRHPNSGRALSGLGQLQLMRGELDEGHATLLRAVQAMPDHTGTWHVLAWAQLLAGQTAAAGESFVRAFELDRNFGETHGGLALVAALEGRLDEADVAAKRALRLDPSSITARYTRCVILEDRGDLVAADTLFADLTARGPLSGVADVRAFARQLRARLVGRR